MCTVRKIPRLWEEFCGEGQPAFCPTRARMCKLLVVSHGRNRRRGKKAKSRSVVDTDKWDMVEEHTAG